MTNPEQREKIARALDALDEREYGLPGRDEGDDTSRAYRYQQADAIIALFRQPGEKIARDALERIAKTGAFAIAGPIIARTALAAIIALDPAPESAIPAGMVAWAGGDEAPVDWDGGPVFIDWGDGSGTQFQVLPNENNVGPIDPESWKANPDPEHYARVLAYTPRPAPDVENDTTLKELRQRSERATKGEWQVQDGCSWRRIGTREGDGNVLCPTNHHRDGHPDLTAGRGEDTYANLEFIVAAVNWVRATLARSSGS